MRSAVHSVVALLVTVTAGCSDETGAGRGSSSASPLTSTSPAPATPTPGAADSGASDDDERDGVVKAPPTVRLRETDEFGIVVEAERRDGAVRVTVDRVDSLGGEEAERAAAADGRDVSNDHYEVNDNPKTRQYVLATDVEIWQVKTSRQVTTEPMMLDDWLAYVSEDRDYPPLFHFDIEDDRVIGIEEQYFP